MPLGMITCVKPARWAARAVCGNGERASQPQLRKGVSATQRKNGLPSLSCTSTGITSNQLA
ncbi:hypothetical protein L580_3301 [Serratia fonticola AU-P3(3)]|nr:hypothetical protein L580_3301 [Serratia fonticola AU-P3(3)]